MLTCWEYTHARWTTFATGAFPKPNAPFDPEKFHKAAHSNVPVTKFTEEEIALINEIRPWITSAMNYKTRPSDTDMAFIRDGRMSNVSKGVLRKWEAISDARLFASHPLTKAVINVPPALLPKYPCLGMLYRHGFWMSRQFKSQGSAASAYAVLCVLEWRHQVATTGRLLALKPGQELRVRVRGGVRSTPKTSVVRERRSSQQAR